MATAYVEDYDSTVSEAIPLTRRVAHSKRISSGLQNVVTYEEGASESGYSEHELNPQNDGALDQKEQAEQQAEREHEQRGYDQREEQRGYGQREEQRGYGQREQEQRGYDQRDHFEQERRVHNERERRDQQRTYREYPRDQRDTREIRGDPHGYPAPQHRRMSSQFAHVMASSIPTPSSSRPPSKNLVRAGSPALRNTRPESPESSGDDSDCDCAKCRGTEKKSPTSPLSTSWKLNYPPFNTGNPMRTGSVPPPMLPHSFPSSYNNEYPPPPPHYNGPRYLPPPPPTGLEEEAVDEDPEPPRRPESTRRERMMRPMSFAGSSTNGNPITNHGSWANAFNNGAYYPPPGPGGVTSPAPPYQNYPPPPPPPPPIPIPGTSASSSPQTQPPLPSSAMGFKYPPYGYPPPSSSHGEMVPMYPPPSALPPPPSLSSSIPSEFTMPPPPMPQNRRFSMRRESGSGDMQPPRDFINENSQLHNMGPPPLPLMNRRSSQRGGQPPHFMPHGYHGEVPRSVSVPPAILHEMSMPPPMPQDARRRVNTPGPLLSSRIRRDSNASSGVASSRLPHTSQLSRFGELESAISDGNEPYHPGQRPYDRFSHPTHPSHAPQHYPPPANHQPHHQRLLSHDQHLGAQNRYPGPGSGPRYPPRHDEEFETESPPEYQPNGHARQQSNGMHRPGQLGLKQTPDDYHRYMQQRAPPEYPERQQLALPPAGGRDTPGSYDSSEHDRRGYPHDSTELAQIGRFRSDSVIGEKREYILGEEPL